MINHQFVWKDDTYDQDDPECESCDGLYSRHVNVEGITAEDEVYGFDDFSDISNRYYIDPQDKEW